jgi:hypothetical protein
VVFAKMKRQKNTGMYNHPAQPATNISKNNIMSTTGRSKETNTNRRVIAPPNPIDPKRDNERDQGE